MILRLLFPALLVLASCNRSIDQDYVRSATWTHIEGLQINRGYFLDFEEDHFDLRGDTIYQSGQARARIEEVDQDFSVMYIRSMDGKETGSYRNITASQR